MIFVTLGVSDFQFNRMIRWVDECLAELPGPREPVFFQIGSSGYRPRAGEFTGFIGFAEMEERIRGAKQVVCHAGVGTVLISLVNGKKPIVIPRRKEYGETVDNHQVVFAEHLARNNLVFYPRNSWDLKEALALPLSGDGATISPSRRGRDRLVRYLAEQVSGPAGDR